MANAVIDFPGPRATLRKLFIAAALCIYANTAVAQFELVSPPQDDPMRTEPVEPFRIVNGVYFVGPRLNTPSYLFTTPEGHILLDTTYEKHVSEIVENIGKLGFSADDIKLLIDFFLAHFCKQHGRPGDKSASNRNTLFFATR